MPPVTPPASPLEWLSASVPKRGHRATENEDALAANAGAMRFAAADGATEGWQSGSWATYLADCFIHRPPTPINFSRWLAAVRNTWTPPAEPTAAAWYAEAKREQGAFSTLLGLSFHSRERGTGLGWKAVAVGDSCLLVVRGGKVETAFPVSDPGKFGTRPPLVPSSRCQPTPEPEWHAGRAERGDLFLLATDAVAAHLLGLVGSTGWERTLATAATCFASRTAAPLVELLQRLQEVLNDDASVLVVRVASPEPSP